MSVSEDGSEGVAFPGAMRGRVGHAVLSEESDGDGGSEISGDEVPTEIFEPDVAIPEWRWFWSLLMGRLCRCGSPQCTMKSVPRMVRGPFRIALRLAMDTILRGHSTTNEVLQSRGWKLFFLLPRMLLSRPPRVGFVSRERLWTDLLIHARECAEGQPQFPEEDGGGNGQTIQSAGLPGPRHW